MMVIIIIIIILQAVAHVTKSTEVQVTLRWGRKNCEGNATLVYEGLQLWM